MKTTYIIVQTEREALNSRVIRCRFPSTFSTLLFLKQGTLRWGEGEQKIEGPALCYWPQDQRSVLQLDAGAKAQLIGLSDTIILDAIGARAESVHLRMLVEQPFLASLNDRVIFEKIDALLGWFVDEMTDNAHQSPMSLSAYLRLLFIWALRVHRPEPIENGVEHTSILRQFRHLVELHYRDHWQVSRYATELGVDYDRLHRICKRETSRSPAELVQERLTAEAKARLENSGFPLKKIASDLGFSDASRFSHFFKRRTDISPGAYRAVVSRPENEDLIEFRRGFSDWP